MAAHRHLSGARSDATPLHVTTLPPALHTHTHPPTPTHTHTHARARAYVRYTVIVASFTERRDDVTTVGRPIQAARHVLVQVVRTYARTCKRVGATNVPNLSQRYQLGQGAD